MVLFINPIPTPSLPPTLPIPPQPEWPPGSFGD
jgi:hypothetical protein